MQRRLWSGSAEPECHDGLGGNHRPYANRAFPMSDSMPLILPYKGEYNPKGISPTISPQAFVAPGAAVVGDVQIGADSGIWFGCVVRGDVNIVRIGRRTNVQDGTVIHVTRRTGPTIIGDGVTIGHSALLHACTLHDHCFVGMRATIMDGAVVESGGWLAAGALLTPNKRVPRGQLWAC